MEIAMKLLAPLFFSKIHNSTQPSIVTPHGCKADIAGSGADTTMRPLATCGITMLVFLLIALLTSAAMAEDVQPANYMVDADKSAIIFSGEHAGEPFTGRFRQWESEIFFAPENLAESYIHTTINTASATTGNVMYDGTLPQEDWFAVEQFPQGHFTSESITLQEDGTYLVNGTLTLRDISHPASFSFPFAPAEVDGVQTVTIHTPLTIDRLAYNIGKKSDADAEWVSQNIDITLEISATAK
jgi:cytochrome b561